MHWETFYFILLVYTFENAFIRVNTLVKSQLLTGIDNEIQV